jgi:hypothetical protein
MRREFRKLALASLLLSAAAFAQGAPPAGTPPPPPKGEGVCRADIAALCPNLPATRGDRHAIAQCLESQQDKLSAGCKAHLDEMKARAEAAKAACQPDVQKFCANVQEGDGRIMQCLHQHASELSDACKAYQHRGPPPGAPAGQPQQ